MISSTTASAYAAPAHSTTERTADLVVVGAGMAGSVAACRAQEVGLQTVLLEKSRLPLCGGNTALSGGTLHLAHINPADSPEVLARAIGAVQTEAHDPGIGKVIARNAGRAVGWLSSRGVALVEPEPPELWRLDLAPARRFDSPQAHLSGGPAKALGVLQQRFCRLGGVLRTGVTAQRLLAAPGDGRLTGVQLDGGEIIRSPQVVIADGGFGANRALRKRFIGPDADRILLRAAASATGDGLRMALELGAATWNLQWFYGHLLHRDAATDPRLWPFPTLDELSTRGGGVVVDSAGRRCVDERRSGVSVANQLAQRPDVTGHWIVLDDDGWDRTFTDPSGTVKNTCNPGLEALGAALVRARSADELARHTGVSADLGATLADYNGKGRFTAAEGAAAPERPRLDLTRLRAVPVMPGLTFTLGGLLIDRCARVLVEGTDRPLQGLYAAGGASAGLQGGPHGGYVGGLTPALILGLLAAESAAAEHAGQQAHRAYLQEDG